MININKHTLNQAFVVTRILLYSAVVLFFIIPPLSYFESRSFCIFYNTLHIKCPGCGTTRAFANVFHGNLLSAWEYNRLIVFWFPLFAVLSLNDIYFILKRLLAKSGFLRSTKDNLSLVERFLAWFSGKFFK